MAKPRMNIGLKSSKAFDDLFTPTAETESQSITADNVLEIPLSKLSPYPNHPFKPYSDEKLIELSESIKENGLLHPIIVFENEQGYHILSGHNRAEAHRLLGMQTIKALVKKDISTETADLIVVESNLKQREKLLPSEKAKAYKMQLEALKRQGKRTDLEAEKTDEINAPETSCPMDTKLNTGKNIAQKNDESRKNIYRYISLNNLITVLLDLVDIDEIPFRAGVELSYLKEAEQSAVYDYFITEQKAKLDLKTAVSIRELSKNKTITYEVIDRLIYGSIKKQKKLTEIKIPLKKLNGILDDIAETKRVDYIMEAVQFYKTYRQTQQGE